MVRIPAPAWRAAILVACWVVCFPGSLSAVPHEIELALDLDNDLATGCLVSTSGGPFAGVEQMLTTTVETTGASSASVVAVTRSECTGGVFGPPIPVDTSGWPVGVGLGLDGFDAVETYLPLSAVGPGARVIRIGVVQRNEPGGESALLTRDGAAGSEPILLDLRTVLEIPTLSEWSLILLVALLSLSAFFVLGRGRSVAVVVAFALLTLGTAWGTAWAAGLLDGDPSEFSAAYLLGEDPAATDDGISLRALFGFATATDLCFRIDLSLLFNTAPQADAQAVSTPEETPVTITLTGSDAEGDPLTFAIAAAPANGSLGVITPINATSAEVTYTPNLDFAGADSFTFTVNDGTVSSAAATVSITVDPVNDAPVANAQAVTTDEEVPVGITLTGSDADGDSLTFAIATNPTNGTLSGFDPNTGAVTYTPNTDFNGADSFTFTVNDGTVSSPAATVSITVDPGNDPPVANAQAVTTDEDVPVVITLTGSDIDGDSLTFAIATGPTNGTLGAVTQITPTSAQVTYTPNADFNGADSFTFTVNDGTVSSPAATVSVTVDPVNDAPVADAQAVTTDEDVPVVITLTGSDVDGDSLTFAIATGPTNGTLGAVTQITPTSAEVTYTSAADFNGADSFTFTVNDGTVSSPAATVSITVDPGNDAPVADAQAVTTDEDVPVVITLTGSDIDGDSLTFAIATNPTNGTLGAVTQVTPTSAEVTYTPNANFNGADNFTFTVNDGTVSSPAATVSITVDPVQDPPTANAQAVATDEDVPVVITLTGSDVDGDSLTFAIATAPSNGSLSTITPINSTSAQVTYTPNPNFFGADSFTFTVNDGTVSSAAATVDITVNSVADPPLAGNDAFSTVGNVELAVAELGDGSMPSGPAFVSTVGNVLANDSDPVEGSGIMIVELQGDTSAPFTGTTTQGGSVTLLADGSFVYTPEAGDRNVVDSFTYVIQNGVGAQATGSVGITIVNELLWFVKNTDSGGSLRAAGLGDGTSSNPFSSLSDSGTINDAEDVSTAGESILVFLGDGSSTNQDQGITLQANQKLFGHSTASLSLGGLTVQTPSPGARPKIDNVNAGGDGITIADATGVEVTGLDISGTDNAVEIRATVAGTFTASIHDNTISSAGGHGIDGRTTAGELRLALDANTGIAAGGSGVLLDGSGGGALYVTSFGGNEVDGATATDGLFATNVIFDADPTTPGFEEVVAGATVIGSSGDPVVGDGLKLTAVKGNLHFTQLDVFNSGGVGIQVVGDTSGGTGMELSAAAGQVESTGDSHGIVLTDVGIDPGDDFLLSRIVSTGSVRGVELLRVLGGDFLIVDGGAASSLTSSDEAIRVEGGTSAVTLNGVSAARTTGGGAAVFGLNHTGAFTMGGGTITHTGGRAVDFDNMDGGSDFTGTTVGTSNHHGKRLVNSAGIHTLPAVVITTAPPAGVDALHLENNTGTTNVGGLSVTTSGSRGLFASSAGTLNLTGGTNQITTSGHSAVEMANTTIGGSGVTFASISATSTGSNEGIDLDNVAGATFQVTGTVTVNTTGGSAAGIDVAGSSAPLTISAVDVDATAGAGIALTGNSGTVTINGGDVNAAAGVAFDVNGGSGNVTYGGTIRNTVDNAVEITGRTTAGRTVTLSNNITHDNGAGGATNHVGIEVSGNSAGSTVLSGANKVIKSGTQNAVHLVSNTGHTIQLTGGGLDIDTTSGIGFNATGGGTVEVVGAGNSVTTGAGIGVNVLNTRIGAGNATFQSVSVNGAPNGIVLGNTLSGGADGGLRVTGTGTAASGGTIQSTSGTGIALTNTANARFSHMQVSNTGSHGLSGSGMVDETGDVTPTLSVLSSRFTSPGDGDNESAMFFGTTAAPGNNTGRIVVTDTVVEQFEESGFELVNGSGSLTVDITGTPSGLTDSTTKFDDNNDTHGQHAVTVVAQGTASIDLNVTGTYMNNIEAEGIVVQSTAATSSVDVNLLNNVSINGGGPDNFPSGGGIALIQNAGGSMTFDVQGNTIRDLQGDGVVLIADGPSEGRIGGSGPGQGNVISGSLVGDGIRIDTDQLPGNGNNFTATVLIQGNNIGNDATFPGLGDDGIQILNRDGTKTLNLTIENNQIANTGSEAIRYFTDADVSDGALRPANRVRIAGNTFSNIGVTDATYFVTQDTAQMCLHMSGNTFSGTNRNISVNQLGSSQFEITQASVAALATANTGSTASSTGTITTGGSCTNPPVPTNP